MLVKLQYSLLLATAFVWIFPSSASAQDTTFQIRTRVALCKEFPNGGVALDFYYRVGSEPFFRNPQIDWQNINIGSNEGQFIVSVPSYFQSLPIHLFAFCRNAKGFSPPSNVVSFSNCDALAKLDTDNDGIPNNIEDTNCDNFYSPGDISNPHNADTDGDGVADLAELISGFDPSNPGSSPRPFVLAGSTFDPDGDNASNSVAWRPSGGQWYIKDFGSPGTHLGIQFGLPGDIPFVYDPHSSNSNIGVIRIVNNKLLWIFNGPGFRLSNSQKLNVLEFGVFGDNIVLGPWEQPDKTNPAVARLFGNQWYFDIYKSDGSIRRVLWGVNNDIPKVQDYDGDGIFDVAVWRPSERKTYVIQSSNNKALVFNFGTGTSDYTPKGDVTGDGIGDVSFWEPKTAMFYTIKSDNGFNDSAALNNDPNHYQQMQLGIFGLHVPLNWNTHGNKILYTVVDHFHGLRYWRDDNNPDGHIQLLQWGLPGDAQG